MLVHSKSKGSVIYRGETCTNTYISFADKSVRVHKDANHCAVLLHVARLLLQVSLLYELAEDQLQRQIQQKEEHEALSWAGSVSTAGR
jgi:hypothetical protein